MNVRRTTITIFLVLVSVITVGLSLAAEQRGSGSKTVEAAPSSKPMTYEKCTEAAENAYKNYVKSHGVPASGSYADKFISLSDSEEHMINVARADAYSDCFRKYGDK